MDPHEKPTDAHERMSARAKLIENLKRDPKSPESQALLQEWAAEREGLTNLGAIDRFEWNREEAQLYLEAGLHDGAVWVLKMARYEAFRLGNAEEMEQFEKTLLALGEDPDDLSEISQHFSNPQ